VPDSIIGFHEAVVVDDLTDEEETAIAVILLRDNGEGRHHKGGWQGMLSSWIHW
jgi:hypothetical protein